MLRRYRDHARPFGGVQLLIIGDLHQLPPVVKQDEWDLLRQHYNTPYFGSLELRKTDPVSIELKHIYRQSDEHFISLLNRVRDNRMDDEVMETLNSRYIPNFAPKRRGRLYHPHQRRGTRHQRYPTGRPARHAAPFQGKNRERIPAVQLPDGRDAGVQTGAHRSCS